MPLLARPRPSQTAPTQAVASHVPPTRKPMSRTPSNVDLNFTLRNAFRKEGFRGCQREAIKAALDNSDVFVLAPTGMGKSLCYQLPALAINHGLTLVVSPLLALMQNQVSYLKSLDLPAATLNSTITSAEREVINQDLNCGHPRTRLLYVTPELASKASFRKLLTKIHKNGELSRFVIDEGHCISEWGHEFRKEYRSLSYFRLDFPTVPIMVLTATATEKVRVDVLKLLRLAAPRLKTFIMSFNRPNLHYEVVYKAANEDSYPTLVKMIRQFESQRETRLARDGKYDDVRPICGIVYAPRRILCDSIAAKLNADGIVAAAYHAGLNNKERERVLDAWVDGKRIGMVVATMAFGMGVDRADVRFVMHYELPKSIEAYYQESGRAGRDRRTARCILFYSREDIERTRYLIAQTEAKRDAEGIRASQRPAGMSNFEAMVKYCENAKKCRHKVLCEYFGDLIDELPESADGRNVFCDFACDVCRDPEGTRRQKMEKLTPMGSQGEDYEREEIQREVEREIFDSNVQMMVDVAGNKENREDRMIIDSESDNASRNADLSNRKRPPPPVPFPRPSKRNALANNVITEELRQQTVDAFLNALNPLAEQDVSGRLVVGTAKRLELEVFDKASKDRAVNPLGRSSTLVTASRKTNLAEKAYVTEKDKLLQKVEAYVNLANSDNVELEQVQQGDIWEVIKSVLDGDS